jgi:hypothetical protein
LIGKDRSSNIFEIIEYISSKEYVLKGEAKDNYRFVVPEILEIAGVAGVSRVKTFKEEN